MLNQTSTTAIARIVLLAGILLALAFLASRSFFPAFAQEEIEFPENGTDPVVAFAATDEDGDTVSWDLDGTDEADFSITNGVLEFKSPPDYENPTDRDTGDSIEGDNIYDVIVVASDGNDNGETRETVTVEVMNVEEDGVISMSGVQPKEMIGLTATLADDDEVVVTLPNEPKWQWATSTSPTGPWNDIDEDGARGTGLSHTFTPTENDVGSLLQATVTYMDGMGEDDLDTDEDESLDKAVFTFDEENRRVLMMDYENTPPMFKTAGGETLPDTSRNIAENSPAGTLIGKVLATDIGEDGMEELLTYSLAADPDGDADVDSFTIDPREGEIKVAEGADLNHEDQDSYSFTVRAADPSHTETNESMGTIVVTINIVDVNEAPEITAGDEEIDWPEDRSIATPVNTYAATDVDEDDSRAWSLASSGDYRRFDINSSTGVLTFKNSPNYEATDDVGNNHVYNITLNVTDKGGKTDSRAVTVTVEDVDEPEELTLSNLRPVVGKRITANFNTGENKGDDVTNVVWRWSTTSTDPGIHLQ